MIFTFGFGHECICGRSLRWCFTEIDGDWETARAKMFEAWGKRWAFQYERLEDLSTPGGWPVGPIRIDTCLDPARCPCGDALRKDCGSDDQACPSRELEALPWDAPSGASIRPITATHAMADQALACLPGRACVVLVLDNEAPLNVSIAVQGLTAQQAHTLCELAMARLHLT